MVIPQNRNPNLVTALNETKEPVRFPVVEAIKLERTLNAKLATTPMTNVMIRNLVTITNLHVSLVGQTIGS
jgi:hypothetical protein